MKKLAQGEFFFVFTEGMILRWKPWDMPWCNTLRKTKSGITDQYILSNNILSLRSNKKQLLLRHIQWKYSALIITEQWVHDDVKFIKKLFRKYGKVLFQKALIFISLIRYRYEIQCIKRGRKKLSRKGQLELVLSVPCTLYINTSYT